VKQFLTTLYQWMADIMSGCYAVTHNYALAIALLTLATVAVTTPLTWKASRGMIAMQALQPEMKKIQTKYKGDRAAMNVEMTQLYKEAGINPLSGCLPLVPQMVVFYILYHTIANLSHLLSFTAKAAAVSACHAPPGGTAQITLASGKFSCSDPTNLSNHSLLYHNLLAAGGHMKVFGFDLTLGVRTAHSSALVGCLILVALVVAAQYWQTRQVNRRNPAASANPQAQMMQRIFPLFFGLISINIQAGVNVYFLVSALCRIAQQSAMFRYDPVLRRQLHLARTGKTIDLPPRSSRPGSNGGAGRDGGSGGSGGSGSSGGGAPSRAGGGLARLLGLADPGPGPTGGKGSNLGRFLDGPGAGQKGGAKGSTAPASRAGQGQGPSADSSRANGSAGNGSARNGSATNASSGNRNGAGTSSRNRRGAPPAKHQDRNRSRSKRSRRSR
jgi:YidC/Oxa1 family membrane protein insertase